MILKLQRRYGRLVLHIVAWLGVFVFPAYLMFLFSGIDRFFALQLLIHAMFFSVLFYVNYLWFSRWYFQSGKRIRSIVASVVLLAILTLVFDFSFEEWLPRPKPPHHRHEQRIGPPVEHMAGRPGRKPGKPTKKVPTFNFLFTGIFVSVAGLGLRYTERTSLMEKQRREMEKEKIAAELAYLRNQISPHFFFNTLNNIYSLVEVNPKEGQQAIISLSKMMRFMLYETDKGDVRLAAEIAFLKNYIDLMKLRLTPNVEVTDTFPEVIPEVSIPPLIFLPFIENAFKHGISSIRPGAISIELIADPGQLKFRCRNTIQIQSPGAMEPDESGIGLENVRKRLELLMPGRHHLEIGRSGEMFVVELDLELNQTSAL